MIHTVQYKFKLCRIMTARNTIKLKMVHWFTKGYGVTCQFYILPC